MSDFSTFKPDSIPKVLLRELKETRLGEKLMQRREDMVTMALATPIAQDEAIQVSIDPGTEVFVRWELDSAYRRVRVLGVHATREGAIDALPQAYWSLLAAHNANDAYAENYLNAAIEARRVED